MTELYEKSLKKLELDAQLAKTVNAALKNGDKQVKIQLAPENLGTLTIDLTRTKDGALQVVLHTPTERQPTCWAAMRRA